MALAPITNFSLKKARIGHSSYTYEKLYYATLFLIGLFSIKVSQSLRTYSFNY